jgi:hypothetical protein
MNSQLPAYKEPSNQSLSLADTLDAFTSHLRQPNVKPIPDGLDSRRVGIYRELVYNNIESCLSSAFPVIQEILDADAWDFLIFEFIGRYRAQTPYFSQLPKEFVNFLEQCDFALHDTPFLPELARYEWLELELFLKADSVATPLQTAIPENSNFGHIPLSLSDTALPGVWDYPVHIIGPEPATQIAQPTYLLTYRDAEGDVHFMELQAMAYLVLVTLQAATREQCYLSATEVLLELIEHSPSDNVTVFMQQGLALFQQLNEIGVLFDASRESQS